MSVLGDTLTQIAAEKGGIIKPDTPVVIAPQKEEAIVVLEQIARERHAPITVLGNDIHFSRLSYSLASQSLRIFSSNGIGPVDLNISLGGEHQVENAAVAYASLKVASKLGLEKLNNEVISRGFDHVNWPGRFEILQFSPPLVVDCAHNRDSALKLRKTIDEYFPDKPLTLVFGASDDKDIQGMFSELMPRVHQMIAVKSFHPRSIETDVLVNFASGYGKPISIIPDVADAVFEALKLAGSDGMVLVTGSIFVAAGARIAWLSRRLS